MSSPTTDDTSPLKSPSLDDSRLGTQLGDYLLTGVLGRGGMGVVYLARDVHLDRSVAVKLLPDHLTQDPERLRRFQKEARSLAAVEHPHVLRIYHVGQQGSLYFVVMEWLRGGSVQQLVDERGALPWPEATKILIDACLGLEAVHAAGLVHRDIKPGNLLRDAHGHVKIADFGLVRYSNPEQGSITAPGQLTGTPEYMSPEQCRREETDARTDIYSVGATYFKLLTGRVPYPDADLLKIMFAHCSAPVPYPRSAVSDLPEKCTEIIQRAIAKEPGQRYPSAAAMRGDLEALLSASSLSSALRSDLEGLADKPGPHREPSAATITFADPAALTQPAEEASAATEVTMPKERSRAWVVILIAALVLLPLLCVGLPILGLALFMLAPGGRTEMNQDHSRTPKSMDAPAPPPNMGDPASRRDRDALVGTWIVESVQPDLGHPLPNTKWIITADKFITSKTVNKLVELHEKSYSLDATRNPKTIDLMTEVREAHGDFKTGKTEDRTIIETAKGIYSLNGDALTVCLCISRPAGDRPAEFVAKPGVQIVVTLKREKPALPGLIQTLNAAGPVTALAFHPTDSAQLFWGTQNGHCQVYDGQVRDLPRLGGPLPDEGVKCVVYTGTGDRMYVLFQLGGAYRFLKLRPGDLPGPLIYPGKFQAIAASPDGFILALASTTKNESKLSFLGPDNKDHGLADTPLGRHNRPVYAMAWPTEDLLVTGGEKGEVIVWDSKTGQKKQTPKLNFLPLGILKSVAITRDGQYILAADGLRFVVNRGDDLRFASENPKLGLAAVVLSPAEPLVAWITGKTIYIQHVDWVQAKTLALEDSPESGELLSLAFSHDGKRLAFGTTRGKVHILEVSKIPSR